MERLHGLRLKVSPNKLTVLKKTATLQEDSYVNIKNPVILMRNQSSEKKSYRSPKFVSYGSVNSLTQSGGPGSLKDNTGAAANMSMAR